jgi:hypothetical protein
MKKTLIYIIVAAVLVGLAAYKIAGKRKADSGSKRGCQAGR